MRAAGDRKHPQSIAGCAERPRLWTTLSGFESLPPSQISFRTTNDHKAGVCECFERRHHPPADGRAGRPQLQGLEELPPPNLRSNPGQLLPRAPSHQAKPPIMANIPSTTPCDRRHDPARAGLRTNRNPANRTAVGRQALLAMASGEWAFGSWRRPVARQACYSAIL